MIRDKDDLIELNFIDKDSGKKLHYMRNLPEVRSWCRQVKLIDDLQQEQWYESQSKRDDILMFSIKKEVGEIEKKLVGICGFTSIDMINRHAEFSLYIFPKFRLNGLAEKALKLLFKHGFYDLNLRQIWGETFENNPAYNLFKKLGMKDDGMRREFYYKNGEYLNAKMISIMKDEFNADD